MTDPKSTDTSVPAATAPIILVEDQPVVIEHHPEDWLAFVLFWALAIIVFLQFFTRYILNDSLSWTEEIARYGLMWVTFIGGAIVVRKRAHIAVEVLLHFVPKAVARLLVALIDVVKLLFFLLLAFFSVTITERMGLQRMTVFDLSMSYVYAGIALGCFLMLAREVQAFWKNVRDGWRRATETIGEGLIVD